MTLKDIAVNKTGIYIQYRNVHVVCSMIGE